VSQISGPVSRVFVQPGADVRPGDVLASVASPDFAAAIGEYRKADAAYRNAKRIADRDEQLFANDALARSDLDQARSDLAAAQADLDANTQQLRSLGVDDSTVAAIRDGRQTGVILGAIRAPIKGTVVEKLVSPGQVVEAGATAAFTVADLATMWVFANVFESDLEIVGEGQKAEIYTEAAKAPLRGQIDYVAALVDPNTKATAVRIVARNSPPVLRRDMLVRVKIFGRRARTGILVPVSAVLRDTENLPYVFLIQPDGSYLRRRVDLGSHIGSQYEIRGGLEAGAKIVADGALFVDFAESQ
jgi:cobalt-zinc-cadmium efflux system membrane fusion protein